MSEPVAVMGGRGKTGRAVARALAAGGRSARVLGRAEMPSLAAHLRGCESVYLIAPNLHPDEPAYVQAVIDAAREAGVARLVYHSVAGPYEPALPHHMGKAAAEVVVRRSGMEWTILQPGVYLQNFLPQLLGPRPKLSVPYDPTKKFTFVDLDDVGDVAAAVVGNERLAGATLELGGPQPMSVQDLAAVAEKVLECLVPVEQVSIDQWRAGPGANFGEREAQWLEAMFTYYSAHGLLCGNLAIRSLLGREPASFAEVLTRNLSK